MDETSYRLKGFSHEEDTPILIAIGIGATPFAIGKIVEEFAFKTTTIGKEVDATTVVGIEEDSAIGNLLGMSDRGEEKHKGY